jgi:ATP-binding cassette subfamily B protein
MEQKRNTDATRLAIKHYWQQVKNNWKTIFPGIALIGLGSTLISYVPALIIARVLQRFNKQDYQDLTQFIPYILLFIFIWALGEIFWRISEHLLIRSQVNGMESLYSNALNDLLDKDIAFFNNNFAGSLTKKVTGYSGRYINITDNLIYNVAASYLPMIFAVIILWHFSFWLVLALISLMALTGFVVFPYIKRRQKIVAARETASNIASGHVADVIGNISAVKAFAHEKEEAKSHQIHVKKLGVLMKKSWDYQNLRINMITSPFYVLTNAVGLILAIILTEKTGSNLSVVFITFSYYAAVTRVMWEFSNVYKNIESAITEAAQFTELLLDKPAVLDVQNPTSLNADIGEIEMRNVTFRYSDNEGEHLFKDFNLKIASGEKVALVGHSGGGKTTVTKLLLRFMDIDGGEILIDGQNIALVPQNDLRSAISYVPQEPLMFHRSLTDNIKYGRLDATQDEVVKIAKLAHADDFIRKLKDGYDTLVGERGVKLSGGQRQRIAIARAMIKHAPILVLDEATSALDSESEKYIQDALWKLMEGRTAIVIAHRLSTVQKMDRIVVLENGEVTEQGTHNELLKKDGTYAKLWSHQSGGFLED